MKTQKEEVSDAEEQEETAAQIAELIEQRWSNKEFPAVLPGEQEQCADAADVLDLARKQDHVAIQSYVEDKYKLYRETNPSDPSVPERVRRADWVDSACVFECNCEHNRLSAIPLKICYCCFGMRVVYGETIFVTVPLNRRHSAMILKLSPMRRHDTFPRRHDSIINEEAVSVQAANQRLNCNATQCVLQC